MGITVTLRGGSGDMLKSTYDPNLDGVIAVSQLDTNVVNNTSFTFSKKDTPDVTKSTNTVAVLWFDATFFRCAFKHTVSKEWIKSLHFDIQHLGNALTHGAVYLRIRKVSDDSIVAEKLICYRDDESDGTIIAYTATFDTKKYVDEECYFCTESAGCNANDRVGGRGVNSGGGGNSYKYSTAGGWVQTDATHDIHGVIAFYDVNLHPNMIV